jgi:c(7)-type cytochrome triheme protein
MSKTSRQLKKASRLMLPVVLAAVVALGAGREAAAEYADVVLNRLSEQNDVRPVIFPHWFHRIRFRCKVCHNELGFKMRAGANEITMGKIIDGQYCGLCHNDEVAWGVDNCNLCHSGKPGLATGIRGSNETGGPGRW